MQSNHASLVSKYDFVLFIITCLNLKFLSTKNKLIYNIVYMENGRDEVKSKEINELC